ncbi:MAG: nitroreductase family protein [Promethearchaeota archaeon]
MKLKEVIYKRRTIRDFTEEPIKEETLTKILMDGMQAPSNSHMRKWEFIIVKEQESRMKLVGDDGERLIKLRDPEQILDDLGFKDKYQREMYKYSIPKQAKMILTAGAVVIPIYHQPFPLLEPKERMHLNYFASIWMCIENILLSAVEEGIFGVPYIPKYPEKIKSILKIPENYEFPCILAIGYPKPNAKSFPPDPIKINERLHFNSW